MARLPRHGVAEPDHPGLDQIGDVDVGGSSKQVMSDVSYQVRVLRQKSVSKSTRGTRVGCQLWHATIPETNRTGFASADRRVFPGASPHWEDIAIAHQSRSHRRFRRTELPWQLRIGRSSIPLLRQLRTRGAHRPYTRARSHRMISNEPVARGMAADRRASKRAVPIVPAASAHREARRVERARRHWVPTRAANPGLRWTPTHSCCAGRGEDEAVEVSDMGADPGRLAQLMSFLPGSQTWA